MLPMSDEVSFVWLWRVAGGIGRFSSGLSLDILENPRIVQMFYPITGVMILSG